MVGVAGYVLVVEPVTANMLYVFWKLSTDGSLINMGLMFLGIGRLINCSKINGWGFPYVRILKMSSVIFSLPGIASFTNLHNLSRIYVIFCCF